MTRGRRAGGAARAWLGAASLASLGAAACGPSTKPAAPPAMAVFDVEDLATPGEAAKPGAAAPRSDSAADQAVQAMIARLVKSRRLDAKRTVKTRVVKRAEAGAALKAQVDVDLPPGVFDAQGEVLFALGMLPAGYDFRAGFYELLGGSAAGFYKPGTDTMFLLDDLEEEALEQTLAHELVHALQDQHFDLKAMTKYVSGASDRIAAAHAVAEGDATVAMFEVGGTPLDGVPDALLQSLFRMGMQTSGAGSKAPPALQATLVAPYSDGAAFVRREKARGGWSRVDAGLRAPPDSTEQLLHPEKYDAREKPIALAAPATSVLGAGWASELDEAMGEQQLRIFLEVVTDAASARAAAAGWGGDRHVLAKKKDAAGTESFALVWKIRMDAARDAKELVAVLAKHLPKGCVERPAFGPFAWKSTGRDVAIVAGPYARAGTTTASAGGCAGAASAAAALLKSF